MRGGVVRVQDATAPTPPRCVHLGNRSHHAHAAACPHGRLGDSQLVVGPTGKTLPVGQLLDRDGGTWTDADGNGRCDVGTAAAPAPEVQWRNAGTTSQTARRFICWLYGPATQPDRAAIAGRVARLTNTSTWPTLDLGGGATAKVVSANGKGVMQADGTTPVSGDHTTASAPPSENDYSAG